MLQGPAAQLATSAKRRLISGLRPATWTQYSRMWTDFLSFLVAAGLSTFQVNIDQFLAFLEYLVQNQISASKLANYVSAIRTHFIMYSWDTAILKDQKISMFIKSVTINRPFQPKTVSILDIDVLQKIIDVSKTLPYSETFVPLYLLAFFSFLRLSNIIPHSIPSFDLTRHLARGDILFADDTAVVLIKWSKTIQDRKKTATISIPNLGKSPLCPVNALLAMFERIPAGKNAPLFMLKKKTVVTTLTDSVARKHLKQVSQILGQKPPFTFHSFRKAGATWAFQHGVPLEHIKSHGTWVSDAVYTYLHASVSTKSPVASAFQTALRQ